MENNLLTVSYIATQAEAPLYMYMYEHNVTFPLSSQVYNARMMDRSPMAQGFLQSFQQPTHRSQSSSSYPYSTPLGPLSPYGGDSQYRGTTTCEWQGVAEYKAH